MLSMAPAARAQSTEIARANALVEEGRIDEAASVLRKALSSYSGEPAALVRYELGRTDTDPVNAATELEHAAVQSATHRAPALLALGELRLLAGNASEASEHFKEAAAVKQGEISQRAAYLAGVALLRAGRFADARAAFADYLVDYLEGFYEIEARIGIAQADEALGERRLALEIYKAVAAQHRGFDEEPWLLAHLAAMIEKDAPIEAEKYRARVHDEYPDFQPEDAGSAAGPGPAAPQNPANAFPVPSPIPPTPSPRPESAPARVRQPAPGATSGSLPAPTMARDRFALQVGAFRDRAAAEKLSKDLGGKGYACEIVSRGDLHVVLVGRYPTQESAAAARPALERIVKSRIIVVAR